MRAVALAVVLLTVLVGHAWATAQTPELLVLNGRVLPLFSTPLAPLLDQREDLQNVFVAESSACWRGYVGTWHIVGDRLYLIGLHHEVYDPDLEDDEGRGGYMEKAIPLSTLFASGDGPFEATWFSGTLRVPTGVHEAYVHMGFGTTYDRELHLDIVRGRVVARRAVDTNAESRGLSEMDRTWVALRSATHAAPPVEDDGTWIDARTLDTAAFREAVPAKTPFLTRGMLDRDDEGISLWIPETLVTPGVRILLASAPPWIGGEDAWPHVELEAVWKDVDGEFVLGARWFRRLLPGETVHHPEFPVPDLPPEIKAELEGELDPDDWTPAFSREDVEEVFGGERVIALHGPLVGGEPGHVHGVDLASAPNLVGKAVVAVGVLEKWIITKRLLEVGHPDVRPFVSRGPGTYYRLVDPYTGRLARPRIARQ